jgi:hypothetical protein
MEKLEKSESKLDKSTDGLSKSMTLRKKLSMKVELSPEEIDRKAAADKLDAEKE